MQWFHYTKSLMYLLLTTTRALAFYATKTADLGRVGHRNDERNQHADIQNTLPFESISRDVRLLASSKNGGDESQESQFDLEAAREKLESMLGQQEEDNPKKEASEVDDVIEALLSSFKDDDVDLPPSPPLSSIERDRREAEIQILQNLASGDDASQQLWSLWYSERGSTAKAQLEKADALMGNPDTFRECEATLKGILDEYGIYFVEPLNRLATLYFLQTKFDKAYKLCLVILKIKPWHFGALSGIVQVCIGMGDRNGARNWAAKRLPGLVPNASFPPFPEAGPVNPRRQKWVDEQVCTAEKLMKKAEKLTQKSFGELDPYHQKMDDRDEVDQSILEEEDGSWQ